MVKIITLAQGARIDPCIPKRIAEWEEQAFGGRTVAERVVELQNLVQGEKDVHSGRLETFVALDDESGEPVGSASLVADALAWRKRPHSITPWITSVFVRKSARRKGIGRRLVDAIGTEALRYGYQELFLQSDPVDDLLKSAFGLKPYDRCLAGTHQSSSAPCN